MGRVKRLFAPLKLERMVVLGYPKITPKTSELRQTLKIALNRASN